MIIRSRAPLRLGFAGGGTDLESYSNKYGGCVFNATIGMYAYCTIIPTTDNKIKIYAYDNNNSLECDSSSFLDIDNKTLILHKGVYNRIVKEFNNGKPLSFVMSTSNDAPIGSGLGTSSTMVVAILEAFDKWLSLGLSDYQKAKLAYDIERNDLKLVGGKQDQYAAVFGGFNYIEFCKDNSVIVNSLRLEDKLINELECSIVLYYMGQNRESDTIQRELTNNILLEQVVNTKHALQSTISAMNNLKLCAKEIKDCLLTANFKGFSDCLNKSWKSKKETSDKVSNAKIEEIITYGFQNGAESVKISGAGGGGFLLFYCDAMNRQRLINALKKQPGTIYPTKFTNQGVESWIIN